MFHYLHFFNNVLTNKIINKSVKTDLICMNNLYVESNTIPNGT